MVEVELRWKRYLRCEGCSELKLEDKLVTGIKVSCGGE